MLTHLVFPSIHLSGQHRSFLSLLALFALSFSCPLAWGQTVSPSPSNSPSAAPTNRQAVKAKGSLDHLYWHFFNYQIQLDLVAAQREQQGQDGSRWRNRLQKKVGFSDTDYAKVRATAQRLQTELKSLDAQARVIINAARAANGLQLGPPLRQPPPPELAALQKQHEATIHAEVANLKTALGPRHSAWLDTVLQAQVVRYPPKHGNGGSTPAERRQRLQQLIQQAKEAQQ